MFRPYADSVSVKTENGDISLVIEGSLAYQDGGYWDERNSEIEIHLSDEAAQELIKSIEEAVR